MKWPSCKPIFRAWGKLKLSAQQFCLFTLAEFVLLCLLSILILLLAPSLHAILQTRASSELKLLNVSYHSKIEQLSSVFTAYSENPIILQVLTRPLAGAVSPAELTPAYQLLSDRLEASKIEFAVLLSANRTVVVAGGQDHRVGSFLDPGGIVSRAISSRSQRIENHVMGYLEYEAASPPLWRERQSEFDPLASDHIVDKRGTGLVRLLATPCFAADAQERGKEEGSGVGRPVIGVLLTGDLVNGKVPIVAGTTSTLTGGYSAVWYAESPPTAPTAAAPPSTSHQATSAITAVSFTQAVSYTGFHQGRSVAMLAGRSPEEAEGQALLRRAWDAPFGTPVVQRMEVAGEMHTIAASRVSPDSPVLLVRGTSERHTETLIRQGALTVLLLGAALLLVDCVSQFLTLKSFTAPLERIALELKVQKSSGSSSRTIDALLENLPSAGKFALRSSLPNVAMLCVLLACVLQYDAAVSGSLSWQAESDVRVIAAAYVRKPATLRTLMADDARHPAVVDLLEHWDAASYALLQGNSSSGDSGGITGSVPWTSTRGTASLQQQQPSAAAAASVSSVKALLSEVLTRQSVEMTMLLDRQGRVIVAGNSEYADFRRGQVFDPAGLVSAVLKSPAQIVATDRMNYEDYVGMEPPLHLEGLQYEQARIVSTLSPAATLDDPVVRWVAVPVFTRNTTTTARASCVSEPLADGVLLYGDVLNGKLQMLSNAAEVLSEGYFGVYQEDPGTAQFSLVSSLLIRNGVGVESDVALESLNLLHNAAAATATASLKINGAMGELPVVRGESTITTQSLGSNTYELSVQSVPRGLIKDSFGERTQNEHPPAYLVRGTLVQVDASAQVFVSTVHTVVALGTLLTLLLRATVAYISYLPGRRLARSLKRLGFLKSNKRKQQRKKERQEKRQRRQLLEYNIAVGEAKISHGDASYVHPLSPSSGAAHPTSSDHYPLITSSSGSSSFNSNPLAVVTKTVGDRWSALSRRNRVALLLVVALGAAISSLAWQFLVQPFTQATPRAATPTIGAPSVPPSSNGLVSMDELQRLVRMGASAGAFLHEMQKERGSTALMIGSGWVPELNNYRLFNSELFAQTQLTNRHKAVFMKDLERVSEIGKPVEWLSTLFQIKRNLSLLASIRLQVRRHSITSAIESSAFYTATNELVARLVAGIAHMTEQPRVSRAIFAYATYMLMKEKVGQERGLISGQLAAGKWASVDAYNMFVQQMRSQQALLFNYRLAVEKTVVLSAGSMVEEQVAQWEQALLQFPRFLNGSALPETASIWFGNLTLKVDKLQVEEQYLRQQALASVTSLIRVEQARTSLESKLGIAAICSIAAAVVYYLISRLTPANGTSSTRRRAQAKIRVRVLRAFHRWHRPVSMVFIAVPLVVLSYVAATRIIDITNRLAKVEAMGEIALVISTASKFLHEAQRERGATALAIGSGFDTSKNQFSQFSLELAQQISDTDKQRQALLSVLSQVAHLTSDPPLLSKVKLQLEVLPAHRDKVLSNQYPTAASSSAYITALNADVIKLVASLLTDPYDTRMFRLMVSLVNFMSHKEMTGLERAALSSAIARQKFETTAAYRFFVGSVSSKRAFFRLYNDTLPHQYSQLYRTTVTGVQKARVDQWEAAALRLPPAITSPAFPPEAGYWFWNMTEVVDQQLVLEVSLRDALGTDVSRVHTLATSSITQELAPYCSVVVLTLILALLLLPEPDPEVAVVDSPRRVLSALPSLFPSSHRTAPNTARRSQPSQDPCQQVVISVDPSPVPGNHHQQRLSRLQLLHLSAITSADSGAHALPLPPRPASESPHAPPTEQMPQSACPASESHNPTPATEQIGE